MSRNVFFIGSFYPIDRENEIRSDSKTGLDYAANNFQWALISGLDEFYSNLKLISEPNIGAFPFNYKKLFFRKSIFRHKDNSSDDYCLSFINFPILKLLFKRISLFNFLKNNIDRNNEGTIIIYGLHSPFLNAAVKIKNKNKKIKLCVVVPDLPQFMSENKNFIYLFLKRIDDFFIKKCLKEIDSFVLLNELMVDELKVNNRPWVLIEGIYKVEEKEIIKDSKEKNKTILYTGNLDERYGIKILVDAFSLIQDKSYRLWIRGNGSSLNYVKEKAKTDYRIQYFEQMSKNELSMLQHRATVLINPVPSFQDFTKYFFPSKTMDYLASKTPTIMTKIEGVPKEYFEYVYLIESENAEGVKETIIKVCNKDEKELVEFGKKAANFIIEKKNHIVQAKKVFDMLNQI